MEDEDFALALQLYEELNKEDEKAVSSEQISQQKNLSIVDPSWEMIDPIPDIRELFVQFNAAYFNGMLAGVEVKWSERMTLCAGVCCYEGRGGLCSIKLSEPLLKLRPRKDMVETLLHEMIHALLFVTDNNKDHDGHGPEFHKHMYQINKETGTNITVYHSFHDEVNQNRQHWWRCNGPCVKRPPYFGIVSRAMNRAPAPRDTWWNEHQRKCGGEFTKIKGPKKTKDNLEKDKDKKTTNNSKTAISNDFKKTTNNSKTITNWFPKKDNPSTNKDSGNKGSLMTSGNVGSSSTVTTSSKKNASSHENDIFQSSSQNSSSNIHGFKMSVNTKTTSSTTASFSGTGQTIGASGGGSDVRESFLSKLENNIRRKDPQAEANKKVHVHNKRKKSSSTESVAPKRPKPSPLPPPSVGLNTPDVINIDNPNKSKPSSQLLSSVGLNMPDIVECPSCPAKIRVHLLNAHLDICLL